MFRKGGLDQWQFYIKFWDGHVLEYTETATKKQALRNHAEWCRNEEVMFASVGKIYRTKTKERRSYFFQDDNNNN